jgi:hypothetical protein
MLEISLLLVSPGTQNRLRVILRVAEELGLPVRDARRLVDAGNLTVATSFFPQLLCPLRDELTALGAEVRLE